MDFLKDVAYFFDEAKENNESHKREHHKDKKDHKDHKDHKNEDSKEKNESHRSRRIKSDLHLVVLKSPSLQKIARNLFEQAVGESDDYSAFAKFMLDLDKLLREYGASPTNSDDTKKEASNEDDEEWKE